MNLHMELALTPSSRAMDVMETPGVLSINVVLEFSPNHVGRTLLAIFRQGVPNHCLRSTLLVLRRRQ